MQHQIASIKQLANDLRTRAVAVAAMLREAEHEAQQSPDPLAKRDRTSWARLALGNVSRYLEDLITAITQRDSTRLEHAAGDLAVVYRYVSDYDYSWYSRAVDFENTLADLDNSARSIRSIIDTFDPINLELVSRALQ